MTRCEIDIQTIRGRDVLALSGTSRHRSVEVALEFWRTEGFPYPLLSSRELAREFDRLVRATTEGSGTDPCLGLSTTGLRFVNHFHPQMWNARSHGHLKSPLDYFHIDEHLRKMLERAPRFWPHGRCWSAQAVRNLARIYAGGRVANFRPIVAKTVIARLTKPGQTVVDFSSGYGGRYLACACLARTYIGIDPAKRQIKGLLAMRSQLSKLMDVQAEFILGCSEDVLKSMPASFADLVFSSPPFFDLEIYSDEPTQSSTRYPTYESWLDCFLHVVIREARRVLRRTGYFAIHTPSLDRHRLGRDVKEIAAKYLRYVGAIDVGMTARPLQRSIDSRGTRIEPILIYRKP